MNYHRNTFDVRKYLSAVYATYLAVTIHVSTGELPTGWEKVTELPSMVAGEGQRVSIEPISQEIYLPPRLLTLLRQEPEVRSREAGIVEAEIEASVNAILKTVRTETPLYRPAQFAATILALQPLSDRTVQVPGFVSGTRSATASILTLLAESQLATSIKSYSKQTAALDSDPPVEDLDSAETITYRTLASVLTSRFDHTWEIDPVTWSFRLATTSKQLLPPDWVLVRAAAIDDDTLRGLTDGEQLELLADAAREVTYEDVQFIVGDTSLELDSVSTVGRDEVIQTHQRRFLKRALSAEAYTLVPAVATTYPGKDENQSLASLLQQVYVVNSEERVMYRDQNGWAADTRLLDLTSQVWQLRNEGFLTPFYDRFEYHLNTETAADLARAINTKESHRIMPRVSADINRSTFQPRTDIYDRDSYSQVGDSLEQLGMTIVGGREDVIERYIR